MPEKPKVVILCGGEGTRLREETEYKPKPMVTVGGLPILWHIMKSYSHYGYNEFVLCLGYKGEMIKEFFLTHELMHNDFTIRLADRAHDHIHRGSDAAEDWTITFADTGLKSMTGSRIKRIEKYVGGGEFLMTYGDGLSNINMPATVDFHRKMGTIATVTAVHPRSKYGLMGIGDRDLVEAFVEKPVLYDYTNGGFFVFKNEIFDYLTHDESCMLEGEPFARLVEEKKMAAFKHDGFWHCMDTYKDFLDLNHMWDEGKRPWKVWAD
jgi:glucose-1-phosphate cytidylyltransferase